MVGKPSGLVYTVPDGFVFICKSLVVFNATANQNLLQIFAAPPGGNPTMELLRADLATGVSQTIQTWVCLNSLDTLEVRYTQGPIAYWISGALLPD